MKNNKHIMKIANFIVNLRYFFLVIFIFFVFICILNLNKNKVNYDITSYLPEQTETKEGLKLMKNEFGNLNVIQLMITNISYEDALTKLDSISKISHVKNISFNNTNNYYKNNNALFVILLDEVNNVDKQKIQNDIIKIVKNDQYYLYIENNKPVVNNTSLIIILPVILLVLVFFIATHSYFDIFIAGLILSFSIIINIGSNFIIGKIPYTTNIATIILQLGLSIYYLILFLNIYYKEIDDIPNKTLAIKKTLTKFIKETFLSLIITLVIFISLTFMQLRIGGDIAIIFLKTIICSILTVILLLPSILTISNKIILKFRHRNFIPDTTKISKIIVSRRKIILSTFLILILISIVLISKHNFTYNTSSIKYYTLNKESKMLYKNDNTFNANNILLLIVKNSEKDYNKELNIAQKLLQDKKILSVINVGNTKINENNYLGSIVNYQEFASIINVDINTSNNLYQMYAKEKDEMIKLNDIDNYPISLINIISFLYEKRAELPLSDEIKEEINDYYNKIDESLKFLENDKFSRFIIEYKGDIENKDNLKLINMIREDIKKEYNNVKMLGDSISTKDLKSTFINDNLKISLITIILILIILMLKYKSIGMTVALLITIEGSILINFEFITLIHKKIFFISYIIVSAIQATITSHYAIIIVEKYQTFRIKNKKINAIKNTIQYCIPKIIISGLIFIIVGILIGYISDSEIISSIGTFLGIGVLITIISTIFMLPSILYSLDRFIPTTTLKKK